MFWNWNIKHQISIWKFDLCLPLRPLGPILRCPVEALWVDMNLSFVSFFLVFFQKVLIQGEYVLAFVIVNEVDFLKGVLDVLLLDWSPLANFVDCNLRRILSLDPCTATACAATVIVILAVVSILSLNQFCQNRVRPIRPVVPEWENEITYMVYFDWVIDELSTKWTYTFTVLIPWHVAIERQLCFV